MKLPQSSETASEVDTSANAIPTQNWGDPDGDGIMADMARVFDGAQRETSPVVAAKEPEKTAAADGPPQPAVIDKEPGKEPVVTTKTSETHDEEFFADDVGDAEEAKVTPVAAEGTLDEAAFDSATEVLTKGMEKKAGDKFKELRAELKIEKQRAATATLPADVQKRVSELELKAQENEGLKQRIEQLASVSAKTKMEQEPEYREQVLAPAAQIFKTADEISAVYEGDVKIIRGIITAPDRKTQNELIKEHLGELSEFDRSEVHRLAIDYRRLVEHRDSLLLKAEEHLAINEARRIEQGKAQVEAQRSAVQTIQKDIWDRYKDKIPGLLDEAGQETPELIKLRAKAMSIDFTKSRGKDQAFAAFAGVLWPVALKSIAELQGKLHAYEAAELRAQKRGAQPSGGISNANATSSSTSDNDFLSEFAGKNFG